MITLSLALTVYQDDAVSVLYLFLMQGLLYNSIRDRGKHVGSQKYITLVAICIFILLAVSKFIIYAVYNRRKMATDDFNQSSIKLIFQTLGFSSTLTSGQEKVRLLFWGSFDLEIFGLILSGLLFVYYNNLKKKWEAADADPSKGNKFLIINNSMFLSQYGKLQILFFTAIIIDSCFAQTFIQLFNLTCVLVILTMWAFTKPKDKEGNYDIQLKAHQKIADVKLRERRNQVINITTKIIKALTNIQIASLSFFSLNIICEVLNIRTKSVADGAIDNDQLSDRVLQSIGIFNNPDSRGYQKISHIFCLCLILVTGQFFINAKESHKKLQDQLLEQKTAEVEVPPPRNFKDHLKRFAQIQKFIATYSAFVCLWVSRICSILIAYMYYGYPGFAVLSWVLITFVVQLYIASKVTTTLYLPVFVLIAFYEYVVNIQKLLKMSQPVPDENGNIPWEFGRSLFLPSRTNEVWPIEVGIMVINICCMITLVRSNSTLKNLRNQFKDGIFERITDKKKNFLFQLSFYFLKHLHIFVLCSIFFFVFTGLNLYFIGLLLFFLRYVSSLKAYRKSGFVLLAFAGFFIWINYIWSLLKKNGISFDSNVDNFLDMLTLAVRRPTLTNNSTSVADAKGNAIVSKYVNLQYEIPFQQWIILFLNFLLFTVNRFFKPDKETDNNLKYDRNLYKSAGEYYEDKNDQILTEKFPSLAKMFIRVRIILSEIMIMLILILQSLTLVFQDPNLLYWGFLVFSLVLQSAVVSATEATKELYHKCVRRAIILKNYAVIVLSLQIAYKLINYKAFLKRYGFDTIVNSYLEEFGIKSYMPLLGFFNDEGSNTNIIWLFLSPIMFYITTAILKDHFQEKEEALIEIENKIKVSKSQVLQKSKVSSVTEPLIPKDNDKENFFRFSKSVVNDKIHTAVEDENNLDEETKLEIEYSKVRFTVPYIIYQRINQWKYFDKIALNFHLITAGVTLYFCVNWQVSLVMLVQFLCSIGMCIRLAHILHKNSHDIKQKNDENWKIKQLTVGNKDSIRITKSQSNGESTFNNLHINSSTDKINNRDNISNDQFFREYITIEEAHQYSKEYMQKASKKLLDVRRAVWSWQYWLLITSMILMYPTPLMNRLEQMEYNNAFAVALNRTIPDANMKLPVNFSTPLNSEVFDEFQLPEQLTTDQNEVVAGSPFLISNIVDDLVWWLFWVGIYVDPKDSSAFASHFPMYILIGMFVLEKICQKWLTNRYGCSNNKVKQFARIDQIIKAAEKYKSAQLVASNKDQPLLDPKMLDSKEQQPKELEIPDDQQKNKLAKIYLQMADGQTQTVTDQLHVYQQLIYLANLSSKVKKILDEEIEFITKNEAKKEKRNIENEFKNQSQEVREKEHERLLRKSIITEIKRKYTMQFRAAVKFILELFILQLLLFSCAQRANIVSILYLGLLLMYILIERKEKGILYVARTIGFCLVIEYTLVLFNISSMNSPMTFPSPYQFYPCSPENTGGDGIRANCQKINQSYTMPIFKNTFMNENLPIAMYLGIDVFDFQLNDIWFDFINLALITVYFFSYGNPLFVDDNHHENSSVDKNKLTQQKTKISFSKTSELEKKLREYTKIQDAKANGHKPDKHQKFLGASFYLMKLKNKAFIYNLTRKMRIFSLIGLQLVSVIFIFTMGALSRSLMSVGYLILCTILFINMKNFFNQDNLMRKDKKWVNPWIIKKPLLIYSFIDIAFQIVYQFPGFTVEQAPFDNKQSINQAMNYPPYSRYLGFDKIYYLNQNVKTPSDIIEGGMQLAYLNKQNMFYFILKSMNLFFIFLLIRIYQSDNYKKFVRTELRSYLVMASNYKSQIMAYFYNNGKLEKVILTQQKKVKMYEGVDALKNEVRSWKQAQDSVLNFFKSWGTNNQDDEAATSAAHKAAISKASPELLTPLIKDQQKKEHTHTHDHDKGGEDENEDKLLKAKQKILNDLNDKFSMQKLRLLNEEDPNYERKKISYKKIKASLPMLAKLYLWINKKFVNQAIFIESVNEATRVKQEAIKGIRRTNCDLKSIMKKEINLQVDQQIDEEQKQEQKNREKHIITKKKKEEDTITLQSLPETKEFVKFSRIIVTFIGVIPKVIISNAATYAYLFMILSMMWNAGFISILYPLSVFGYALMEEARPSKHYWGFITFYTILIIFVKTLFQLDIWFYINQSLWTLSGNYSPETPFDRSSFPFTYDSINNKYRLGLKRVEGIIPMFLYILPEFLVLISTWTQQFYEIMLGVHDSRETDIENVSEARDRFLDQFNNQAEKISSTLKSMKKSLKRKKLLHDQHCTQDEPQLTINGQSPSQSIDKVEFKFMLGELKNVKKERDDTRMLASQYQLPTNTSRDVLFRFRYNDDHNVAKEIPNQERLELNNFLSKSQQNAVLDNSLIPNYDLMEQKAKDIRLKKKSRIDLMLRQIKDISYFKRLFPLVKEEKPGKDMYAQITFWLFVICVYMINFYQFIDARGTQILQNTNQYSKNMTVMVIILVVVLILERYIGRTNVRRHNKGIDAKKQLEKNKIENSTSKSGITGLFGASKTHAQTIVKNAASKSVQNQLQEEEKKEYNKIAQYTQLEATYITIQQVLKWILQIILLLGSHYLIFWLFPVASNEAIYGQPTCKRTAAIFSTYGCFDFGQNWALIIFYILFCQYFRVSALQIRHGLPEWREPSSLTAHLNPLSQNLNLIYFNLPFLVELKTSLDWCFTKTSLDIFQWLELAEINNQMYNAKMGNSSYYEKKLGTKIGRFEKKLCGCVCLGIMLFFLVGPFVFFSNMRFIASYNPVNDLQLDFGLQVSDLKPDSAIKSTYEFQLFTTQTALQIYQFNENQFENVYNFSKFPETKFFDPQQVQMVNMKEASDTQWDASQKSKLLFKQFMDIAANDSTNNELNVTAVLRYKFFRNQPATAMTIGGERSKQITKAEAFKMISSFNNCSNLDARYDLPIENFIPKRLRLGTGTEVSVINIQQTDFINETDNFETAVISYSCRNYWALSTLKNKTEGIHLKVFSDLMTNSIFSDASLFAFYLGTALTIGTIFRTIVMYKTDRIFVTDARNPEKIRNLITAIFRQRLEGNLKREDELFFLLFEILRNPQLFTHLTGSSLKGDMDQDYLKQQEQLALEEKAASNGDPDSTLIPVPGINQLASSVQKTNPLAKIATRM